MEAARLATSADVPRLAELFAEASAELAPTRGGAVFLAREIESDPPPPGDEGRPVWVGTLDEFAVGYAAAHVEQLRDGMILGVIDHLFVEEGARDVGVGEALMDELLGWFRSRDCDAVDAIALPGNRQTKNFFETAGFSARLIVMHHKLRSDDSAT
ncbi:MAG: N-acetyltransferase family protein [Acidimicrobiia bacterium]